MKLGKKYNIDFNLDGGAGVDVGKGYGKAA
jgi:hypothetical protein